MDINYYKEFVVLADIQNYLEASESLFISQSTLSKHIQAIEKELNCSLFDRTTRKVQLTEYGKVFLEYAKQMAEIQYQCNTSLMNLSDSKKHSLTIGSIPVMAPYHITDLIMKFQKENPLFSVNLIEGESASLKKLLLDNKCELAFVRDEHNDDEDEFSKIQFEEDYLIAVLPIYHPLANEKTLTIDQLKNEDFLLLQPQSLLYNLCLNVCKNAGFNPKIIYTGQRAENIIDLIEKGMGISLLMRKPVDHLSSNKIKIIPIKPTITTQIKIYYKKDSLLSTPAKHFINAIQLKK